MDNDLLAKDLAITMLTTEDTTNLESSIKNVLANYSIVKLKETLPATRNGQTSRYLTELFVKDKLAKGLSTATLKQYVLALQKLYVYLNKEINLATRDDIVNYLSYYKYSKASELKPNTIRNRYLQLSSFYTWLFKNKYIAENPFDTIDTPKSTLSQEKVLSVDEKERIMIACEYQRKGIKLARDIALVMFLGDTGMRVTECSNVQIKDVDFDGCRVAIRHGKGDKARVAYFGKATRERLFDYLSYRKDFTANDYLFTHYYRNKKLTKAGIENSVKTIAKISNIERLHPHLLRATLATNLHSSGVPTIAIQQILGHADLSTLESYIRLDVHDVQSAFNNVIK